MTTQTVNPSTEFRKELMDRGGNTVTRCYQCATCSSVCELAPVGAPFPRAQMLGAQWGLQDKLINDPAIWLCHQCNDCTTRCPRDAKPGDVMSALRSMAIEKMAVPSFLGKLVGNISFTWPLVLGLPLLFWATFLYFLGPVGLDAASLQSYFNDGSPESYAFHFFAPHWMIYLVNIPVFVLAFALIFYSASKAWAKWGEDVEREGSFIGNLVGAFIEIASHKSFNKCQTAKPRKWGHFLFMWGFVGAFITTALVVIWFYAGVFINSDPSVPVTFLGMGTRLPFELMHPWKILGNISAVLLFSGGVALVLNRLNPSEAAGASRAFDNFFLFLILGVALTGITTEVTREFLHNAEFAGWSYLIHLGFILCLFATIPYSKFAHFVYRTLAIVHERMVK